jgi:hypothetical protein
LFDSKTAFDDLKKTEIKEEKRNPVNKLLSSQNSIMVKAKNFNKQRRYLNFLN